MLMSNKLNYMNMLVGLRNAGRAITGNETLNVNFADIIVPFADSAGNVTLRQPVYDWPKEEWTMWLLESYHEFGHLMPDCMSDYDVLKKYNPDPKSLKFKLMNIISDYCQEKHKFNEYLGRRKCLSEGWQLVVRDKLIPALEIPREPYEDQENERKRCAYEAMHAWNVTMREDWMTTLSGLGKRMYDLLNPLSKEYYDKIMAGNYSTMLDEDCDVDTHGKEAAWSKWDLVERLMDEVFEIEEEDKPKESASAEGSKEEGDTGEEQQGEELETSETESEINYSDLMVHDHDTTIPEENKYAGVKINYEPDKEYDKYTPYSPDQQVTLDLYNKKSSGSYGSLLGRQNRLNRILSDAALYQRMYKMYPFDNINATRLSKRLARLLRVFSRTQYVYGQKKGKLHNKNLYRVALNIHGHSERVFKKKVMSDVLDTAVTVLLDCSGSMAGERMRQGGKALMLLSELLYSARIDNELLGFTDIGDLVNFIFKPFGAPYDKTKISEGLTRATDMMSQNADGDSILWAVSRLIRRPERRKLLIVLSDGSPAGGQGGDIDKFTRDVGKDVESSGTIEICGIGILDRNVKRIYNDHYVIKDVNELEDALLNVIKRKVL